MKIDYQRKAEVAWERYGYRDPVAVSNNMLCGYGSYGNLLTQEKPKIGQVFRNGGVLIGMDQYAQCMFLDEITGDVVFGGCYAEWIPTKNYSIYRKNQKE